MAIYPSGIDGIHAMHVRIAEGSREQRRAQRKCDNDTAFKGIRDHRGLVEYITRLFCRKGPKIIGRPNFPA